MRTSVMRRALRAVRSIGLLTALAAGAIVLTEGPSRDSARAQPTPPAANPATERINVEQAVSFPYDI